MRVIIEKKKLRLPQIAAAILVTAAVMSYPTIGICGTSSEVHGTVADGAVITAASKNVTATNKAAAPVANKPAAQVQKKSAQYHESIYAALKHQGLTGDHLGVWREEHPLSTLNQLEKLAPAKQKKVANAAGFIRKVNPQLSAKTAWREACALVYYSSKYNVPSDLAVGIAKAESRFNPSAQSKSGALGPMQVMWKIHHKILRSRGIAPTREHMFDPERGVEAGIYILSRYINAYGSVQKALNRYYGGIAKSYLKKVNNNVAQLQRHSNNTGY